MDNSGFSGFFSVFRVNSKACFMETSIFLSKFSINTA